MRHLILILMIALLPLRSWIGDAMATDMATQAYQIIATKTVATHAHQPGAEVHFHDELKAALPAAGDCGDHASSVTSHAEHSDCQSCSACQACNTALLLTGLPRTATAFSASTPPRAVLAQFASAEAALSQKPPIS